MRILFLGLGLFATKLVFAQQECRSFEYQQQLVQQDPLLKASRESTETFLQQYQGPIAARTQGSSIIRIPVIVHILYHSSTENLSDELVRIQIAVLNRDFRKMNADTNKIPSHFKSLAADCEIEFELARVDPQGRTTNGIIHKYTPVTKWGLDDKIKFSSEMGNDAWDTKSYLNIWVGTLDRLLGYSSFPGDPANKDGIVLSNRVLGGRIAVHEAGHWLGLRHLWGDADCGDDGVNDTPRQQGFTNGCPSTIRVSCGNAPYGDLYMDYMDFTAEACLVMFTHGQKQRMRALFDASGPRYSMLTSKGLGIPWIEESPLPETPPKWLYFRVFPNPATTSVTLNVEYDARWIGKELQVISMAGQIQMRKIITSKIQQIDLSQLKPGVYFIRAEKDGEKMIQKLIKL